MTKKKEQKSDQSPDGSANSQPDRRRALKNILTGAGVVAGSQALPEKWMKPAVSTIVLPAHAGVSPGVFKKPRYECDSVSGEFVGEGIESTEVAVMWEGLLSSSTEARDSLPVRIEITAEATDGEAGVYETTSEVGEAESFSTGLTTAEGEAFTGELEISFDIGDGGDGSVVCGQETTFTPGEDT